MTLAITVEAVSLVDYEARIETGLRSYIEVGRALDEIRASRVYKDVASSFEGYCAQRWSWTPAHAWHLIHASRVAECLYTFVEKPRTEAYARPLAPLLADPDRLREVWQSILSSGCRPITIKMIADAVDAYRNPSPTDQQEAVDMPSPSSALTEATPAEHVNGIARQLLPPLLDPAHLLPGQQEKARYSRAVKSLRVRLFEIVQAYPSSASAIELAEQVEMVSFDLSADDCRRLSDALTAVEEGRRRLKRALESKRPRRKEKGTSTW